MSWAIPSYFIMLTWTGVAAAQSAPVPQALSTEGRPPTSVPERPMVIGAIPASPPRPVAVAPAELGIDEQQQRLADLEMQAAIAAARLRVVQAEQQAQQLQGNVARVNAGIGDVPELVAVTGSRNLVAEFRVGARFVVAADGDWLTPDWRVVKVAPGGVDLVKRNGQRHTALLGQQPVEASAAAPLVPASLGSGPSR